ncbi:FAD-dependent oxidoreductase [Streptomyces sp. NBC_00654]|uniref:NAD(P)/FAD-dependent oxidoreductase n=1 Tax=Streptomyces sp. NBC_00654 TaxID=2975799 RepID=UPI002255EEFB|nr:FAD-dependent oxidoreductase [Streptomyces sp. NBC_00654]MCX4970529.1 FAD-dependent oxidoreductase [Streptomyces sp. NBC_00654]
MGTGPVVIVGAGHAALEAAAALRAEGHTRPVILVGAETAPPYARPPLSKDYLTGRIRPHELWLRPRSFFAEQHITAMLGDRAVEIDRDASRVRLASGERITYDRLILATGSRPRRLSVPGADLEGVVALRSLADAEELRCALRDAGDLLVVGGGFIGLEVASVARGLGLRVTVVESGPHLMGRSVSRTLSAHLATLHRAEGTRVLLNRELVALRGERGHVRVAELNNGARVAADVVVVGIGVLPNTALAAQADLTTGDGVIVDRWLRTSDRSVYAIGDCARFPSPHTARPVRLESVQNASDQARCVAAALTGHRRPYISVPWFWTEQCGARVQMAGITRDHDRTVVSGSPAEGRFSVFCFRGGRLVGTESVNRSADHMITRRLLANGAAGLAADDVARPGFDIRRWPAQPI